MSKDYTFNPGDFVVYPAHGIGRVTSIETTNVAGQDLDLIAVQLSKKDKGTLRIPSTKVGDTKLRQVSSPAIMESAVKVLQGPPKVRRILWAKRALEYNNKIASGCPIATAEVIRDLYKDPKAGAGTFSERQILEQAMERFSSEYAVVYKMDEPATCAKIDGILQARFASAK